MRKGVMTALVGAILLAGCVTSKSSQKLDNLVPLMIKPEPVANYARDVVWAAPGGDKILLDVSWPAGEGPFPVLVWLHGGSWEFFSKEANEGLGCYITNRGYVVVNANYRMVPEVTMKTIVEDAMGAVIWAKDHAAEYHGDPARMAVAGHSAGGHLAAMVADECGNPYFTPTYQSDQGNDCKVRAAIPVSGVYDMNREYQGDNKIYLRIMGATPQSDPELYRQCSPLRRLRPDLPPQLVVYAEKEELRADNENYIAALKAVGAPVESYMQPGENHLWPTWHWKKSAQQTYDRMIKFLDENLKGGK